MPLCETCGDKGYIESAVFTQAPASLLDMPSATRVVCPACSARKREKRCAQCDSRYCDGDGFCYLQKRDI